MNFRPSNILDEAFIGDGSEDDDNEDGSDNNDESFDLGDLMGALPSPDQGFNENISHAQSIDDRINQRMADFIDDPLDMETQDYMKALDISS